MCESFCFASNLFHLIRSGKQKVRVHFLCWRDILGHIRIQIANDDSTHWQIPDMVVRFPALFLDIIVISIFRYSRLFYVIKATHIMCHSHTARQHADIETFSNGESRMANEEFRTMSVIQIVDWIGCHAAMTMEHIPLDMKIIINNIYQRYAPTAHTQRKFSL